MGKKNWGDCQITEYKKKRADLVWGARSHNIRKQGQTLFRGKVDPTSRGLEACRILDCSRLPTSSNVCACKGHSTVNNPLLSVQFSPLTNWVFWGTWKMIQQRSFSGLFCCLQWGIGDGSSKFGWWSLLMVTYNRLADASAEDKNAELVT